MITAKWEDIFPLVPQSSHVETVVLPAFFVKLGGWEEKNEKLGPARVFNREEMSHARSDFCVFIFPSSQTKK